MKDWKEELNKRFPLPKILAFSGGAGVQRDLLIHFIEQIISERDKEWYKNLELATTAISKDGKVRFIRIDEPDFTNKLIKSSN